MKTKQTAILLFAATVSCCQTALCLPAYKLEEICAFPPGPISESGPWAPLVTGPDGAFYGTTYAGGSNGYGSVFRVTTSGLLTTPVSFTNTNGANPRSALLLGSDGVFYGTTAYGGRSDGGTAFHLTTNGDLTTLAHFDWTNGAGPVAALVWGPDGALYGTTAGGGSFGNFGTIYRLTTNGVLTSLVSFGGTNGYFSDAPLLLANDEAFYGTTIFAGPSASPSGYGNVFRITPGGNFTSIATFAYTNGAYPTGSLVEGTDGGMYGTTVGSNSGEVFRVTTNGDLSVVIPFDPAANPPQGTQPRGGLVHGSDGAFYGTTSLGGSYNNGTVFRVTTNGLLTTLASFTGTNGASPRATLVQGSDGAFYGTTRKGGSLGGGNVFRLVVFSRMVAVDRAGEGWNVTFNGVPGETYRLSRSTNLSGPWDTLTNVTLGPDGNGQSLDSSPPADAAFYRTVTP